MSIETVPEKISHGNIEHWKRKARAFLATNPVCLGCGEELWHFTRIMMCWQCRVTKNYQGFLARNPGYQKQWHEENRAWDKDDKKMIKLNKRNNGLAG